MNWQEILLKELEYKGSIVSSISNVPSVDIPKGFDRLEKYHVTLLSNQQLKPMKEQGLSNKEIKEKIKNFIGDFPLPPKVVFGENAIASRNDGRQTLFFSAKNQGELQAYLDSMTEELKIPKVKRFFHVSVANNQGGNPFKSIGDINEEDIL
tara:strand:- start:232 stop:687 length:456 start_codon:yes stop_codon:yes gene_type:complete